MKPGHQQYISDLSQNHPKYLDAYLQSKSDVRHPREYSSRQYFPYSKTFWNNTKTISKPQTQQETQDISPHTHTPWLARQPYYDHTTARPVYVDIHRLPADRYEVEYVDRDVKVEMSAVDGRLEMHEFRGVDRGQLAFAAMMHTMLDGVEKVFYGNIEGSKECVDLDMVFDGCLEETESDGREIEVQRMAEVFQGDKRFGGRFENVFGLGKLNRFQFTSLIYPEVTNSFVSTSLYNQDSLKSFKAKLTAITSLLNFLHTSAAIFVKQHTSISSIFTHIQRYTREDFITLIRALGVVSHNSKAIVYVYDNMLCRSSDGIMESYEIDEWIDKLSKDND